MVSPFGNREHPTKQDHATIRGWMAQQFGAGPVQHEDHIEEYYLYQAEREGATYSLEITQEAFDDEATSEIVANLDRRGVAKIMLAESTRRLMYMTGGRVVSSPRAHPRRTWGVSSNRGPP